MKVLILNLKRSLYRKQHMIDQMEKYNITNYEFIEAIDHKNLTQEDLAKYYNPKISYAPHRLLRPGEIACSLSHKKIYNKILEDNSPTPYIILEDDVTLTLEFTQLLKSNFTLPQNADLVYLGFRSSMRESYLNNPSHKNHQLTKSFLRFPNHIKCTTNLPENKWMAARVFYNDYFKINEVKFYKRFKEDHLYGTFGYIISKHAMKEILKSKLVLHTADDIFNSLKFNSYIPNRMLVNDVIANNRFPESEFNPFGSTIVEN